MQNNFPVISKTSSHVFAIALALVMQSCYVTKTIYTENIFNSWIGRSSQELLIQQGTPSRTVPDGENGQVYIYDESRTMTSIYSSPGYFYNRPVGVAVPGYQQQQTYFQSGNSVSNQILIEKKVEFFINKDGYIYAWHSTGYPETYQQRYAKKELESGSIDQSLFVPPGSKR